MVDKGKAETQRILKDMNKNNMYLKSTQITKAILQGERYYNIVKENRSEMYRAYIDTFEFDDPTPMVEVLGNKYKVSNRRKRGYKSPSEL